jgi:hypothetical protein
MASGRLRLHHHPVYQPQSIDAPCKQRWAIENQWHWPRDNKPGEDDHRCSHRNGVPVFAFLQVVMMNLRRCRGGYGSICQGFWGLTYDIKGVLAMRGVAIVLVKH